MLTFRRRFSYANVMSTLAVVLVATGGTAWAAKTVVDGRSIKRGTVGAKQIASNAVTSAKVKNGSLLAADFKKGQLAAGAAGPAGPAGAVGAQGPIGAIGATGPTGERGLPGDDGDDGDDGAPGQTGPAATAGTVLRVIGTADSQANGAALRAAVVTAAAATFANPYLIQLGGRVYDLDTGGIALPDFVSITGTDQNATLIRATLTSNDPVVLLGNYSALSHLGVRSTNSSDGTANSIRVIGVAGSRAASLNDVDVTAASTSNASAIILDTIASQLEVRGSTLTARGASTTNASAEAPGTHLTIDGSHLLDGVSVGSTDGQITVTNSVLEPETGSPAAYEIGGAIRIAYSRLSTSFVIDASCAYITDLDFTPRGAPSAC